MAIKQTFKTQEEALLTVRLKLPLAQIVPTQYVDFDFGMAHTKTMLGDHKHTIFENTPIYQIEFPNETNEFQTALIKIMNALQEKFVDKGPAVLISRLHQDGKLSTLKLCMSESYKKALEELFKSHQQRMYLPNALGLHRGLERD